MDIVQVMLFGRIVNTIVTMIGINFIGEHDSIKIV